VSLDINVNVTTNIHTAVDIYSILDKEQSIYTQDESCCPDRIIRIRQFMSVLETEIESNLPEDVLAQKNDK
tara:strand:+ start:277 stop:489 length:213 start_codon:yes stop_codon:yes gene_type:complete